MKRPPVLLPSAALCARHGSPDRARGRVRLCMVRSATRSICHPATATRARHSPIRNSRGRVAARACRCPARSAEAHRPLWLHAGSGGAGVTLLINLPAMANPSGDVTSRRVVLHPAHEASPAFHVMSHCNLGALRCISRTTNAPPCRGNSCLPTFDHTGTAESSPDS